MGNDGGSIPTRRELVKEAARNPTATELKDKQKEHLAHRWSTCPVSNRPLVKPVVSDYSGDLYNKDAIIQFLLPTEASSIDKDEYEHFIQGRIKSLKDVVEIQFETELDESTKQARWICPITSKQLGPSVKAVYLVPCGHAFSQEAIREMKDDGKCVQCGTSYNIRDVIPILPSTEDEKAYVLKRIDSLKTAGLTHALKKASGSKKRKATEESLQVIGGPKQPVSDATDEKRVPKAKDALDRSGTPQTGNSIPKESSGIKNSATASLTSRVLQEEEARNKRRRENDNISSLYTKKSNGTTSKNSDFMTRGFSIPTNARHQ